ncbi:MAG: BACON domain-containing protein [Bacteroidaceae bacterium]|nr:BACON domain-containing protein [Bacteroidaceae bacterium]
MKRIALFTLVVFSVLLSVSLISCSKDEVPSGEDTILPYIEADQIEFTISAEPQSVVIHALTNVKWSAKVIGEDTGWLGMPAVEKSGDNLTIRIEVSENKAAESRKAFISLKPMEEYSLPKDYSIGDDMFFINQAAPNP